eukprot:955785-Karenia_brevis.AAC.1
MNKEGTDDKQDEKADPIDFQTKVNEWESFYKGKKAQTTDRPIRGLMRNRDTDADNDGERERERER